MRDFAFEQLNELESCGGTFEDVNCDFFFPLISAKQKKRKQSSEKIMFLGCRNISERKNSRYHIC